jgi:cytidylate kinase
LGNLYVLGSELSVRELIVVDGRSGSGKTQWASNLASARGFEVLSLDEVYPGWDGLDAGQALVSRHLLPQWFECGEVDVPQWDWVHATYRRVRRLVSLHGLIIEGCGSLTEVTATQASESVWLEASDDERFERAMARDGESYRPHWRRWALQEERFLALHHSPERAGQVIET